MRVGEDTAPFWDSAKSGVQGPNAKAVALQGGRVHVDGVLDDDLYVITSEGGPAGRVRMAANLSDSGRILEGRDIPARSAVFLEKSVPAEEPQKPRGE